MGLEGGLVGARSRACHRSSFVTFAHWCSLDSAAFCSMITPLLSSNGLLGCAVRAIFFSFPRQHQALRQEPKQLPLVLNVHGGPWARDVWGYRPDVQWFTNRGYAVLQVITRAVPSVLLHSAPEKPLHMHILHCGTEFNKPLCHMQVNYRGSTGMLLCEQCDGKSIASPGTDMHDQHVRLMNWTV